MTGGVHRRSTNDGYRNGQRSSSTRRRITAVVVAVDGHRHLASPSSSWLWAREASTCFGERSARSGRPSDARAASGPRHGSYASACEPWVLSLARAVGPRATPPAPNLLTCAPTGARDGRCLIFVSASSMPTRARLRPHERLGRRERTASHQRRGAAVCGNVARGGREGTGSMAQSRRGKPARAALLVRGR